MKWPEREKNGSKRKFFFSLILWRTEFVYGRAYDFSLDYGYNEYMKTGSKH